MMMLNCILKNRGLFSKEIKTRIAQKQILVNGNPIENDIEINVNPNEINIMDIGDLMFSLMKNDIWQLQLSVFGIENLATSNITNKLTEELKKFLIVRTSKKNVFVIKLDKNEKLPNDTPLEQRNMG